MSNVASLQVLSPESYFIDVEMLQVGPDQDRGRIPHHIRGVMLVRGILMMLTVLNQGLPKLNTLLNLEGVNQNLRDILHHHLLHLRLMS